MDPALVNLAVPSAVDALRDLFVGASGRACAEIRLDRRGGLADSGDDSVMCQE